MTTTVEKTTAAAEQAAGPHLDPAAESAVVDHDVLRGVLAGRWAEQRREARRLAADPRLHIEPGTHWSEHREKTFENLAILAESTLSFLGVGIQLPEVSLGNLVADAQDTVGTSLSYLMVFPGLTLLLVVLCVNFVGDGLRDSLDPRAAR